MKTRLVFKVNIARKLVRMGYRIVDLKPAKTKDGKTDFIFDFSNCDFIDSTGLGALVSIYKKCVEKNGSLKLKSLKPEVDKLFKLTRLDKVFDIE